MLIHLAFTRKGLAIATIKNQYLLLPNTCSFFMNKASSKSLVIGQSSNCSFLWIRTSMSDSTGFRKFFCKEKMLKRGLPSVVNTNIFSISIPRYPWLDGDNSIIMMRICWLCGCSVICLSEMCWSALVWHFWYIFKKWNIEIYSFTVEKCS